VAEDEPDLTTDFTVMEQNQTEMEMNLDDGMGSLECDKSCVCSCGREFNSLKGMRIHATRKKCNGPAVEKPLDYECVCGRRFGTERGLKIHHGRKKCYGNADGNGNDVKSDKTSSSQVQDIHHSNETNCAPNAESDNTSPEVQRICWPKMNDEINWKSLPLPSALP
jgi:hypothetical protein